MSIAFDDSATSGPATKLAAAAAGLVLLVALLAAGAGAGVASLLGGGGTTPSATATSAIPPAMLALYQQAATTCPGLPWTVLAAIGTIESDNGTSTLPGVQSGANAAGAEGLMQMLGPTFAAYDQPVPPGGASPPSPYDPTDAVYAAARMLCANGAAKGADISGSVFAYNHASWYVTEVLSIARSYGQSQAQTVAAGTAGGIARRLGARPGRHAVHLGRRDPRGRLRLLRPHPGCLQGRRHRRCPAPRRSSTTRPPSSAPTTPSNQATSSSSEAVRPTSATSASTSATVRWSTPLTRGWMSGSSRSPRRSGLPGVATSTSALRTPQLERLRWSW